MTKPFEPEDNASLYLLRPQDGTDESFYESIGSDVVLNACGLLEGEFMKAETVASAARGSGRKCVDLRTTIVNHDPGIMCERVTCDLVVHTAETYALQAGEAAGDTFAQTLSQLEQDVGTAAVSALGADTLSTLERIANATIRQAAPDADLTALIQSVMDAHVAPAAAEAAAIELQRTRAALLKRTRARDAHYREGRPDRARAVTRALAAWASARIGALEQIERRACDDADMHLARANEAAAEAQVDSDADREPSRIGAFKGRVWSFLFADAQATPPPAAAAGADVQSFLRSYLRSRLIAASANQMRIALATAAASGQADDQRADRLLELVATLATRAKEAAASLDERSAERMRRATGLFLPCSVDIRTALVRDAIANAGDTLINRAIREPLIASLSLEDELQYEHFEDGVLTAVRRLTNGLREDSLPQLLARLSAPAIDAVAKLLASAQPTLAFRPGHPAPQIHRRIAVPDGASGPLGMAIRRRFTGIDVVRSNDPLLAFGVAVTDVFSVDQLEAYHGRWGQAREDARAAGIDRRLVSDRRLLDFEDGLTSNGDLDAFVIRGVACGCIASSKEPPVVERASGTWYLMPAGQLLRPSQLDPARLDAVFNGHRLGRSLAEIRTTLRHAPHHRQVIDERWQHWCDERTLEQRAAHLDVVMANLLPSDELAAPCRELKNMLHRQLRLRIEAA